MSKLFQISEEDLETLEMAVPFMYDRACDRMQSDQHKELAIRAKAALSNVRWNYGPYEQVEIIPVDSGETP